MVYCSADDVKGNSQVTYTDLGYASDSDFVAFLNNLIALVDGMIDNYCRVPAGFFEAGGLAVSGELLDYPFQAPGMSPFQYRLWLVLWYHPVLSVQKVEYNTAGYQQTPNWVTIVEPDYIVKLPEGLLMLVNKIPALPFNSVRVGYTAGYSATPTALKQVAIQLCCNALHVILQRKVSPVVRVGDWALKIMGSDIFSRELQVMLAPFINRSVTVG